MAADPAGPDPRRMLPGATGGAGGVMGARNAPQAPTPTAPMRTRSGGGSSSSGGPIRQMSEMPRDELEHLAEEFGLDPSPYKSRQALVAAIHDRRQMIAAMDREAMLDVVKWARRPVPANASNEQLAIEIARARSMQFSGLSARGLLVLARLRGVAVRGDEPVPVLVRRLRQQEGLFRRLNRKRRSLLGSLVSRLIGEDSGRSDYQFLPQPENGAPAGPGGASAAGAAPPPPGGRGTPTIKDEIEESGLFGGIAGRLKRSADTYVNQKLDEIEARIDRKLDEIDRRLAEWRDKEIANRIRILKITLWASVIVAAVVLIYAYITRYMMPPAAAPTNPPQVQHVEQASRQPSAGAVPTTQGR